VRFARAEVEGSVTACVVEDDGLVPFATEGIDLPPGGAQEAIVAAAMARSRPATAGDPVPASAARLLAPIGRPPSVRDFYAF
jgi:hypothetical protein